MSAHREEGEPTQSPRKPIVPLTAFFQPSSSFFLVPASIAGSKRRCICLNAAICARLSQNPLPVSRDKQRQVPSFRPLADALAAHPACHSGTAPLICLPSHDRERAALSAGYPCPRPSLPSHRATDRPSTPAQRARHGRYACLATGRKLQQRVRRCANRARLRPRDNLSLRLNGIAGELVVL